MICPDCHGQGSTFLLPAGVNAFEMRLPALTNAMRRIPCRTCGGSGIASCCDAAGSAQPEPDRREDDNGPA